MIYVMTVVVGEMDYAKELTRMTDGDEKSPTKQQLKILLQNIKTESRNLLPMMWTSLEIVQIQNEISQFHQKMKKMMGDFTNNLYWYQKRLWKNFEPDKDGMEARAIAEQIRQEKARLAQWVKEVYTVADTYLLNKGVLPENVLFDTLMQYGYDVLEHVQVLDVACGDGQWLRNVMNHGGNPDRLIGTDIYEPVIEKARMLSDRRIQFLYASPDELPFEHRRFDIILVFGLFMHVLDEHLRNKIARALFHRLNDNGLVICVNLLCGSEAQLEPYLAYTTRGLGLEDVTNLFPDCQIDFNEIHPYGMAVIRKIQGEKGDKGGSGN